MVLCFFWSGRRFLIILSQINDSARCEWQEGIDCYKRGLFCEAVQHFQSSLSTVLETESTHDYRIQLKINMAMALEQVNIFEKYIFVK